MADDSKSRGIVHADTLAMVISVFIAIVAMVSTAVWTVASVQTTTAVLTEKMATLGRIIDKMYEKHDNYDMLVHSLEVRVSILENGIRD